MSEGRLPALYVRRHEDRRLRGGHPWVFSNEVDVARSPLAGFEPGQSVTVRDHGDRPLGSACVNPRSLIAARFHSRSPDRTLDAEAIRARLAGAAALRERFFDRPFYRLVYGESDGLPGLVVDRHGPVCVAQVGTAGMERLTDAVVAALEAVADARSVVLRNDAPHREHEGLERHVQTRGEAVPDAVPIEENGARFEVDALGGQKTGWYYDHRRNRARLARLCRGARVLDLFAYTGAWGVQALCAGASRALCVDTSEGALDRARRNAALNDVAERLDTRVGDAFDVLKALAAEGERFDAVVVDPPAFVRRRKDLRAGLEAYQRLQRLALRVLAPDGLLVSASCSAHLSRSDLLGAVRRAARSAGRPLRLVEQGHQGPDHPVHPALPESEYLKSLTLAASG